MTIGKYAVVLAAAAIAAGCATGTDPRDPYESFNRSVYRLNDRVDTVVAQPAARAYRAMLPSFVRTGVANVFSNIGDVRNVVNNGLQGKFADAYSDFGRIIINTTLGMGGVFDVASHAGVEKHNEDFGQTLGTWGASSGSFIVLPIFGPTTTRDALGRVFDYASDPVTFVNPFAAQLGARSAQGVDNRAQFLEAGALLKDASLDPYLFMRDAYLQRRQALVRDGQPAPAADDVHLAGKPE
jgi:phospholipid-binding lipoprotein MlaA